MKLHASPRLVGGWLCYDDDTYDCAPDAGKIERCIGFGKNEAEAIADWKEQWAGLHGAADWEEYIDGIEHDRQT